MLRSLKRAYARNYIIGKKIAAKVMPPSPPQKAPAKRKQYASQMKGKVAIVTGSTKGIGLAVAQGYASAGAKVVVCGRNAEEIDLACTLIHQKGGEAIGVTVDLREEANLKLLVDTSLEHYGHIDIVVNNAGVPGPVDKPIWEVEERELLELFKVNVTAPFLLSKHAIQWSEKNQHPVRIVNVSSGIVGFGAPSLGAYHISKSALEGLTQALSVDSLNQKSLASVVSIKPRSVRSSMTSAYYSSAEYNLMDEPDAVIDGFLVAATATSEAIMGKSLSEPGLAIDPNAEITLGFPWSFVPPININPETYREDTSTPLIEKPGAYMHFLENPLGLYSTVEHALSKSIKQRTAHCYPDPAYSSLKAAIGKEIGVTPSNIALGNGSSELLDRVLRLFIKPGETILTTKPTWSFLNLFVHRYGLLMKTVPMVGTMPEKTMRHNLAGLLNQVDASTKLIYLVNPCNPTGTLLDAEALHGFISALPSHVTLLLDEAYIDYVEPSLRFNLASIIDSASCNVIGLRTFSKFFALSGARVGYAYANKPCIDLIEKASVPFNVANNSQLAAMTALEDGQSRAKVFDLTNNERQKTQTRLDQCGIDNQPSHTSFILFNCPLDPNKFRQDMAKHGLILPNIDQFPLKNYAVIPVGLPQHNEIMLDYLAGY